MADLKNLEQAKVVYNTICRTLENNDWHYTGDDEKLKIECGARGEDLPMELSIYVDAERRLIMLISHLPFAIQEDKRLDVAIGVTAINNVLVNGCFDYDVATGNMIFRMTNSFIDSVIGEDTIKYMLFCSCQTIDEYNDKLLMLAKGMLSIEQLLKVLND